MRWSGGPLEGWGGSAGPADHLARCASDSHSSIRAPPILGNNLQKKSKGFTGENYAGQLVIRDLPRSLVVKYRGLQNS